jgi:hypothetical protein
MTTERGTSLVRLRAEHARTMLRVGSEHAAAMERLEESSAMPPPRTTLDERQPPVGLRLTAGHASRERIAAAGERHDRHAE